MSSNSISAMMGDLGTGHREKGRGGGEIQKVVGTPPTGGNIRGIIGTKLPFVYYEGQLILVFLPRTMSFGAARYDA
jgi:hypothetical protein